MVTKDSPYLTTHVLLQAVVKKNFLLLFLFKVVSANRHQTEGSNGNSITTTGNVSVAI